MSHRVPFSSGRSSNRRTPSTRQVYQLISNRECPPGIDNTNIAARPQEPARPPRRRSSLRRSQIGLYVELEEDSSWRGRLLWLVQSVPFQTSMALAIIANAIIIGLETDMPDYPYWGLFEYTFLIVFALELIARMVSFGLHGFFYIYSEDFFWNTFDAIIVLLGVIDGLCDVVSPKAKQGGGVATLFRMVRLFRILRIFKIIRFLKQLYLLAHGFIEAAQSVFWVTMLMLFVLYICSIVLVRTVGNLPETSEHHQFLNEQYGTIVKSMLSLFDLMSQPDMHPYHGMRSRYPFLTLFLICWIIFGSFGMIALLTGVISESMFEKNALRIEGERLEREQKRNALNVRLGEVFEHLAEDSESSDPGEVGIQQVIEALPEIEKVFDENMIAYTDHDMMQVVNIMDADESGTISKEEFIHGLVSIAEEIRPMSIAELFHSVQLVKSRIAKCQKRIENLEQTTQEKLSELKMSEVMQNFKQVIQESSREFMSNLELKIAEGTEAQAKAAADSAKAAADSSLMLETLQGLVAGSSQQHVLGVPAVDNHDSGLAAKLTACESGILETRDLILDLQSHLKKPLGGPPSNREFHRSEGASAREAVSVEDPLKAAYEEMEKVITRENTRNDPERELHDSYQNTLNDTAVTSPAPSAVASNANVDESPHQQSDPNPLSSVSLSTHGN